MAQASGKLTTVEPGPASNTSVMDIPDASTAFPNNSTQSQKTNLESIAATGWPLELESCEIWHELGATTNWSDCRYESQSSLQSEVQPNLASNSDTSTCHECAICDTGCGNIIAKCRCPRCPTCKALREECLCEECRSCGGLPHHCSCRTCTSCNCFGNACICIRVSIPGGRLYQSIPTTSTAMTVVGMVNCPIVLTDNLDKVNVLVFPKPTMLCRSAAGRFARTMANSAVGKMSSKVTTKVSGLSKKLYNKARFALEPMEEDTHTNVTTICAVTKMVSSFVSLPDDGETIALSFDCEGDNLGRNGVTCYLQIRDELTGHIWLIDLLVLGQQAWTTTGADGVTTLKTVFENKNVVKLIFDVRGDSDALYSHYGVRLAGVLDVQYLGMLKRAAYWERRPRYTDSMRNSRCLTSAEQQQFDTYKCYPYGNDYSKFKERPLQPSLKAYAINDVMFLRRLASKLKLSLTDVAIRHAFEWTQKEIEWTQEEHYYQDHYDRNYDRYARAKTKPEFAACWDEVVNINQ